MASLTEKQAIFCKEYIKDFNATRATIAAGYSESSAKEIGSENLTKPNIQAELARLMRDRNERLKIDADYVLDRLVQMDNLDIIDIVSDDMGSFKPLKDWPKEWRISISGLDISTIISSDDVESVVKKIKRPDKVKNLELIGKHTNVKAFEKETITVNTTHNIMPVPVANSVEEWEQASQETHNKNLNND